MEEKRDKILSIYHSSKGIFNLKEIEKAASQQGVVSQSVKASAGGKHMMSYHMIAVKQRAYCGSTTVAHFGRS